MDLQALANKYGMPIKIVSITDFNDSDPKIEQMQPDGDFEVEQVIEEMILLNTGNYHFDLIKKKQSEENTDNSGERLEVKDSKSEEPPVNQINDHKETSKHSDKD